MHRPSLLYLLAAGGATAALQRLVPNAGAVSPAALFGRQADECTSHSTCAECYGEGYVVCDTIGCFNPDKYQQCCKDACESALTSRSLRGITDKPVNSALRGQDQQVLLRLGKPCAHPSQNLRPRY